jgi:hypothetical protein
MKLNRNWWAYLAFLLLFAMLILGIIIQDIPLRWTIAGAAAAIGALIVADVTDRRTRDTLTRIETKIDQLMASAQGGVNAQQNSRLTEITALLSIIERIINGR